MNCNRRKGISIMPVDGMSCSPIEANIPDQVLFGYDSKLMVSPAGVGKPVSPGVDLAAKCTIKESVPVTFRPSVGMYVF